MEEGEEEEEEEEEEEGGGGGEKEGEEEEGEEKEEEEEEEEESTAAAGREKGHCQCHWREQQQRHRHRSNGIRCGRSSKGKEREGKALQPSASPPWSSIHSQTKPRKTCERGKEDGCRQWGTTASSGLLPLASSNTSISTTAAPCLHCRSLALVLPLHGIAIARLAFPLHPLPPIAYSHRVVTVTSGNHASHWVSLQFHRGFKGFAVDASLCIADALVPWPLLPAGGGSNQRRSQRKSPSEWYVPACPAFPCLTPPPSILPSPLHNRRMSSSAASIHDGIIK